MRDEKSKTLNQAMYGDYDLKNEQAVFGQDGLAAAEELLHVLVADRLEHLAAGAGAFLKKSLPRSIFGRNLRRRDERAHQDTMRSYFRALGSCR